MADLGNDYNRDDHKDPDGFEPLPKANYKVSMIDSDAKVAKTSGNAGIAFTFEILDGEYKGRKLFEWCNWGHPDPTVSGRARSEVSMMQRAVGVSSNNTEDMHGKPMIAEVDLYVDRRTNEKRNRINGYHSTSNPPATAAAETAGSGW